MKLGTVISDIFGVSGRNILARLLEKGYVDEADLDECLRGKVKKKKQAIYDSLLGTLTEHELLLIRLSWKHITELESLIDEVDQHIDRLLEPYREEVELLMTMPGVKKRNRRRGDCRDGCRYERLRNAGSCRLMDRIVSRQP